MKVFILIFSIVIALVCFWAGFKMIALYVKVKKNWVTPEASVLSKKVEKLVRSSSRASHAVRVEYQYEYQSKKYTGNKVYLAELLNGQVDQMEADAQKVVDKLPEKITVYVNPENPEQSVIYCSGIGWYVLIVVMGFVSLLVGIAKFI